MNGYSAVKKTVSVRAGSFAKTLGKLERNKKDREREGGG